MIPLFLEMHRADDAFATARSTVTVYLRQPPTSHGTHWILNSLKTLKESLSSNKVQEKEQIDSWINTINAYALRFGK